MMMNAQSDQSIVDDLDVAFGSGAAKTAMAGLGGGGAKLPLELLWPAIDDELPGIRELSDASRVAVVGLARVSSAGCTTRGGLSPSGLRHASVSWLTMATL